MDFASIKQFFIFWMAFLLNTLSFYNDVALATCVEGKKIYVFILKHLNVALNSFLKVHVILLTKY